MATTQTSIRQPLLRADVAVAIAALALVTLVFWEPVSALRNRWLLFDQAYSHGFFVFGLSLFLLYRVFRDRRFGLNPSVLGVLLAALTSLSITLANVVNVQILQQLGVVFLWWAVIVALLGWRAGWHLALPIGFIYYAIPVWNVLTEPLVYAAVEVNQFLLGFRGIHFRVDGAFIHLLDVGIFEVGDACSGLRYLVIALTLATLFSALNFTRVREWLILHATAIAMGLLVNWVRIFVIILVGYETEMQSGLVDNHELFGWILFVVVLVPFFFIANRLMHRSPVQSPISDPTANARRSSNPLGRSAIVSALLVFVVAGPMTYLGVSAQPASGDTRINPPESIGGWKLHDNVPRSAWRPQMHGADRTVTATYTNDGNHLDLGIWYYATQTQGSELVQYNNRLYDSGEWRVREHSSEEVNGGGSWGLMVLEHRHRNQSVGVGYGYEVADHWTHNRLMVKVNMLQGALTGRQDGSLVTLSIPCADGDCQDALATLRSLLRSDAPAAIIQSTLNAG
ncbi:EpsI family protein [Aquisalimonas lutea]|uniref:exosortase C-terminal domain/associated protein EpsI n=1 Tax=Aquisalimonas lutea TaxID=1327750 RepID=UPI0025B5641D|nr:exosortase C-terminal domain/associated protein EpsI [Aquisalimonas lutea]MDN3517208.1 EpsI family protein [Aquisalimonas lutea]